MHLLSIYMILLEEGPAKMDSEMIWTIILIAIVVLLIIFGRRILLLINGKNYDDDEEILDGSQDE